MKRADNPRAFEVWLQKRSRKSPSIDLRIQQALELLWHRPILQMVNVAATLNLSPSRFRHLFKKEIGMSPKCYERRVRLLRARELLEGSPLRVKEIAAWLGIVDVSHFVRDYKVFYGLTPSQARAFSGKPRPRTALDSRFRQQKSRSGQRKGLVSK